MGCLSRRPFHHSGMRFVFEESAYPCYLENLARDAASSMLTCYRTRARQRLNLVQSLPLLDRLVLRVSAPRTCFPNVRRLRLYLHNNLKRNLDHPRVTSVFFLLSHQTRRKRKTMNRTTKIRSR